MSKVVKFGGSSLASAEQFQKVANIIHADKDRRYVVPSAPGKRHSADTKVTDMLYECYALAEAGEPFYDKLMQIKGRYDEIITGLNLNLSLVEEFERIKENFQNGIGTDYAASRGEYLNGIVMAEYLQFQFLDAAEVIFFDEKGNFLAEKTNEVLGARVKEYENVVLPGFYGVKPDGTIKTFDRSGSDITGSILARAVQADIYENWTDVSGFLLTDPRIVKNPPTITTITYKELRELAYMGATVLHGDAILPVCQCGIPINIRNTNKPEDPGTMIVESTCKKPEFTITGIAGKKGFVSINIEKDKMNGEVGFGSKVLQAFEQNGISFEHMPTGIDTLSVFVHQQEFEGKEQKVLSTIHRLAKPDSIEIESDLALVAVVGRGMKSNRGVAARVLASLAHKNINIKMIDQGSSELNIILGVTNEDFEMAIQAIYDIFVVTCL